MAPNGIQEVKTAYGWIKIEPDKIHGGWRIYDPIGWEATNMVMLPSLPGLETRRLYVHKKIVAPLRAALEQWQATCPDYQIKSIGCFCPRPKRTNALQMSLHSWGAAVDINPAANPLVTLTDQADPFRYDMPNAFLAAFRDNGWTWGGDFKGLTKDPMHMQYASGY